MEGKQSQQLDMSLEVEKFRMDFLFEKGIDFANRSVQLTGIVGDDFDFSYVDNVLSELERQSKRSITLKLNSAGGSVVEALAIVGRIRASKCKIVIEGFGVIQSAATMILACGDKRRVSKYAMIMHHQAHYGMEGKHKDVKHFVEQLEKEEKLWCKWLEEFTGKEAEFWYKSAYRDFYITAEEALNYGIVDEII